MGQEASTTHTSSWKGPAGWQESDGAARPCDRSASSRSSALLRRLWVSGPFSGGSHPSAEPRPAACHRLFPNGLGPCGVSPVGEFRPGDVLLVERLEAACGGVILFPRELFRRSPTLLALALRIDRLKGWTTHGGCSQALEARVSPLHTPSLTRSARRAAGVQEGEVKFVWVYPAQLDWRRIVDDDGPNDKVLDSGCPEFSFFAVGGFLNFRAGRTRRLASVARPSGSGRGLSAEALRTSTSKGSGISYANALGVMFTEIQLFSASTIAYDPGGALEFAEPRRLEPSSAERLVRLNRFQPVSARKWTSQGARFVSWVRPGEALPDAEGRERPFTLHGGFAFLFRGLREPDVAGQDIFFEVISLPPFWPGGASAAAASGLAAWAALSSPSSASMAIAYSVGGQASSSSSSSSGAGASKRSQDEQRRCQLIFRLAGRGQWPLVLHMLMESPHLAKESDERGETLLHYCARHRLQDRPLLEALRDRNATYDARSAEGKVAEQLGDRGFRRSAREVWGLAPDLFEDPEGWFDFWDKNSNGTLEPCEVAEALTATYRVDEVGKRWVRSYANTHHRGGVTKARFFAQQGLFQELQFSSSFDDLGRNLTPPLFRGKLQPLSDQDCADLVRLEERLAQLRKAHGWRPGARAPASAHRLQMPSPFPGSGMDVEARMRNARQMLSFSLAQTSIAAGPAWLKGFRINFAGQDGVDDGGLTKAWGQELTFALWGNDDYFEARGSGWYFFKPDAADTLQLDGQPVRSVDLYRWTGRFLAYLLYQHCLVDCFLSPWAFRALHRIAHSREWGAQPEWPETPDGEDRMLDDLASLDAGLACSLWRVRNEMADGDLQWLDFTTGGVELLPDGGSMQVCATNKAQYVRLSCVMHLMHRARAGIQAFAEGFLEVIPGEKFCDLVEGGVQRLLLGAATLSDAQLNELERLVVPGGLVPVKLCGHTQVREAARWFFQAARAGNGQFRSRLLEFWIGTSRVPLRGVQAALGLFSHDQNYKSWCSPTAEA